LSSSKPEIYAERRLETHAYGSCTFSTARVYRTNLHRHVPAVLGGHALQAISRDECRTRRVPREEVRRERRAPTQS